MTALVLVHMVHMVPGRQPSDQLECEQRLVLSVISLSGACDAYCHSLALDSMRIFKFLPQSRILDLYEVIPCYKGPAGVNAEPRADHDGRLTPSDFPVS